jgi:hypothetical protein
LALFYYVTVCAGAQARSAKAYKGGMTGISKPGFSALSVTNSDVAGGAEL